MTHRLSIEHFCRSSCLSVKNILAIYFWKAQQVWSTYPVIIFSNKSNKRWKSQQTLASYFSQISEDSEDIYTQLQHDINWLPTVFFWFWSPVFNNSYVSKVLKTLWSLNNKCEQGNILEIKENMHAPGYILKALPFTCCKSYVVKDETGE